MEGHAEFPYAIEATLDIATQIILIITFTNKLNLRLIRVFHYIQRFNLNIRHKSKKQHIVSNILFRLIIDNHESTTKKNELNVLFIVFLIEMNKVFRKRLIDEYKSNFV